jgi:hypothetical protein
VLYHLVIATLGVCLGRVMLRVVVVVRKDVVSIRGVLVLDTLDFLSGLFLSAA